MSSLNNTVTDPNLLYGYEPSMPLAIIGAILFLGVTLIAVIQFFHNKTWCFWPMIVGGLVESSSFIARGVSVGNSKNLNALPLQYIAIILAPSLMAAECYLIFSRLVLWVTPSERQNFRTLWCSPRFITLFFNPVDFGSFLVQLWGVSAIGASYSSNDTKGEKERGINLGLKTLKLGLILQVVCLGIFALISARFLVVSRYWNKSSFGVSDGRWRRLGYIVNIAAGLIMLRAIYRILELTGPREHPNYLYSHEWPFWIFDALPIFVFLLFSAVHPGHYLPRDLTHLVLNRKRLAQSKIVPSQRIRMDQWVGNPAHGEPQPFPIEPAWQSNVSRQAEFSFFRG